MDGEVKCPDERVNKLQFDNINKIVDKITEIQVVTDGRLTVLEKNSILMTSEFSNLKQNQDKQSILMYELDKSSNENNNKKFEKILLAQEKTETRNDTLLSAQTELLTKIVENQNSNADGRIEITKGKIAIILAVIAAIVTLAPIIVESIGSILSKF